MQLELNDSYRTAGLIFSSISWPVLPGVGQGARLFDSPPGRRCAGVGRKRKGIAMADTHVAERTSELPGKVLTNAGLMSFAADQKTMDDRVAGPL